MPKLPQRRRIEREEQATVGSSARAMLRSLSALANKRCACEAEKASIDRPVCKEVSSKGGTETKEAIGVDPTQRVAAEGWIPETGRPWDGTEGDAPGAQVAVAAADSVTSFRSARVNP